MIHILIATLNAETHLPKLFGKYFWHDVDLYNACVTVLEQETQSTWLSNSLTTPHLILQSASNLGCAGARQYLVHAVQPQVDDRVIFLDDDIYMTKGGWLSHFLHAMTYADIVGVAPRRADMTCACTYEARADTMNYVSGGWMGVTGAVLQKVEFDALYYPNYYEDVDFCFQAREFGYSLGVVTESGLCHRQHTGNTLALQQSAERFLMKWGGK